MKITFVLPGFARKPVGGIRVVYTYADHLVLRGHDVTVIHVARFRDGFSVRAGRPRSQVRELLAGLRDSLVKPPATVSWHDVAPEVTMSYVPTISEAHLPDSDVLIATAWQTADPVAALAPRKGHGVYFIQHHETWSGRSERVDATWRLPLTQIVTSRWLAQRALELGLPNAACVPCGMDVERFSMSRPLAARGRRVAMMHSKLHWKGAADGITALVTAREQVPDLEAVLFGTSPRPSDLPSWIEYEQDPTQDRLVSEIYNRASVYLCPSHSEGWGLPNAEAMACGCAVVSTDNGGIHEFATAGLNVLLSPPRDVPALTANLVRVLQDQRLRERLAVAGNEAVQEFTWDRSASLFEAALLASVQ